MTNNTIPIKNNALQFKYFSNKNKPEKDWIPFGNIANRIFYKVTQSPFRTQKNLRKRLYFEISCPCLHVGVLRKEYKILSKTMY